MFEEFAPSTIDDYISQETSRANTVGGYTEFEPYTDDELNFIEHVIRTYHRTEKLTADDAKRCTKRLARWIDGILHGDMGRYLTKREQLKIIREANDNTIRYSQTNTFALIRKRIPKSTESIPV